MAWMDVELERKMIPCVLWKNTPTQTQLWAMWIQMSIQNTN